MAATQSTLISYSNYKHKKSHKYILIAKTYIMETKFIEGTNKQYSIREDGNVIRHYRWDKWGNKLIKDVVVKSYIRTKKNSITVVVVFGFPQQQHSIRRLMENYFDIEGEYSKILGYKDGDKTNHSLSNLYYIQNKDIKETSKSSRDKAINNITKWYAASKLQIPVDDLTDEMYNLYKANLQVKRLLSQKTGLPTNLIHKIL